MRALARAADGLLGPPVCGVDALGSLIVDPPGTHATDLLATREEQVAGWVRVVQPGALEAPVTIESLVVHPAWRGRGIGRRLVERVHERVGAAGRDEVRVAVPEALLPIAQAWGATDRGVSRQVFQTLALAGDGPAPTRPDASHGLVVAGWGAVAPDHLAEGVARLEGHGDMAVLRALERMRRTRGRAAQHTALVEPGTRRVLGYTSISLPASSPQDPEQAMTVVDPDTRGQGYGELLKTLNVAALLRDRPWAQRIWTANDEDNRPMASLNERLGFLPWQYRRVLGWSL
jgi:GNAT superfamily N-acetyltransferase